MTPCPMEDLLLFQWSLLRLMMHREKRKTKRMETEKGDVLQSTGANRVCSLIKIGNIHQ